MKRAFIILGILGALGLLLLVWNFIFPKDASKAGSGILPKGGIFGLSCVNPDRTRFGNRWKNDTEVPLGDHVRIAGRFLEGDAKKNGEIVGAFFKSIDTFPSMTAAQFYEKELVAFATNPKTALPYWNTPKGSLLCDPVADAIVGKQEQPQAFQLFRIKK